MKSPLKGLPDLVPDLPKKGIRLSLSPVEAVAVYMALDKAVEAIEGQYPNLPDGVKVMLSAIEYARDSLGDRLTFRECP